MAYQEEMARLEEQALGGLDLVGEALGDAVAAVQRRDEGLARAVIAGDDRIDDLHDDVHAELIALIARQAPVAGDLRLISALMEASQHIERMGDQCVNIAKLVLGMAEAPPLDERMSACVAEMGEIAGEEVRQAKRAFAERDVSAAEALLARDEQVNIRNKQCFALAVEVGRDPEAREAAMFMALIARALERVGDNAVDIGELAAFVVTGHRREFRDASHPAPAA
jgi:phosphate transport system protein